LVARVVDGASVARVVVDVAFDFPPPLIAIPTAAATITRATTAATTWVRRSRIEMLTSP